MEEKNKTSFDARFYKTLYSGNNGFSVNICLATNRSQVPLSIQNNKFIPVVGNALPNMEGVTVKYFGEWVNGKRGMQFNADAYEVITPKSERGLISFLSSDLFPGIGPKKAERMVDMFGKDIIDIIENNPQMLLKVKGINEDQIGQIVISYKNARSYSKLAIFLADFGIGGDVAMRINKMFGQEAITKIKANPYIIMDIKGIGFKTADKIALKLGVALDSYDRISSLTLEVLKNFCEKTGGMFMEKEALIKESLQKLNETVKSVSKERYIKCLSFMKTDEKIVIRFEKLVYLKQFDQVEYLTSRKLIKLLKKPVIDKEIDKTVDKYCAVSDVRLSEKQKQAVKSSLKNRVSIITGGPGTGKTTIIKAIISCYLQIFAGNVICMAPTGKASRRMAEATGFQASTIHSRLALYEGESSTPTPIPAGLVIVDETSMVDNVLMSKLMEAISEEVQIIFVGDIHQLPSVGVGAVLQEMISSEVIPTTRLTEIFRQKDGGSIVENAIKINGGGQKIKLDQNFTYIPAKTEEKALDIIVKEYLKAIKVFGIDNVALLTPLRKTQDRFLCVADHLNEVIRDAVNPLEMNLAVARFGEKSFRYGDRVLQWKNGKISSNGDIGEITAIYNDEEEYGLTMEVFWDNGSIEQIHAEQAEDITLAYAMSVHKSQGSEYDCVIIPLLDCQSKSCALFKRNLLYTAITRAKKKVILVGDTKTISKCITQSDTNKRNTLLSERLKFNAK